MRVGMKLLPRLQLLFLHTIRLSFLSLAEAWNSTAFVVSITSAMLSSEMPPPGITVTSRSFTSSAMTVAPSRAVEAPPLVRTRVKPSTSACRAEALMSRVKSIARWKVRSRLGALLLILV